MSTRRTRSELVTEALVAAADALVHDGKIATREMASAAVEVAQKLLKNEYQHEQSDRSTNVNQLARQAVQAKAGALVSKDRDGQ